MFPDDVRGMTFSAQRNQSDADYVDVQVTHGPVAVKVSEHYQHLRHFWGQLGNVLCEAEGKTRGQRSYERYAEHSQGVSLVSGAQLPVWEELEERIRAAWEHSAAV